jgi:hypothetical protein
MTKPRDQAERSASVQGDVLREASQNTNERRKNISAEAVTALAETRAALEALARKRPDEALPRLENAIGKLELILSREPSLELAPTDVKLTISDLLGDLDAIKGATRNAKKLVDDDRYQEARMVLADLASEAVISTTSIPLGTYPAAMKRAAKLVDEGKLEDATVELETAVGTVVITRVIHPLPILRATHLLERAEQVAGKAGRTPADNESLSSLLENARYQLEMAEALGYGAEDDFEDLYARLDEVRDKARDGKVADGFFTRLKERLTAMNKTEPR